MPAKRAPVPAIVSSSVGSSRSGGSAPSSTEASSDVISGDVLKISCAHQDATDADLTLLKRRLRTPVRRKSCQWCKLPEQHAQSDSAAVTSGMLTRHMTPTFASHLPNHRPIGCCVSDWEQLCRSLLV